MTDQDRGPGSATPPAGSDLGRRVRFRRCRLGLSLAEVAARAGASPGYLRHVEEDPAEPGAEFLLRLADALDTTVAELVGGTVEFPPGLAGAAARPEVLVLDTAACWTHLGTHGVGRVAVTVDDAPAIFPVNYTVTDGGIAFRTAPESGPAAAAGDRAALEVDHLDDAFGEGWSVLVVGPARAVTDPAEDRRLTAAAHSDPWVGARPLWIALDPVHLTGRRIHATGRPAPVSA
ncbi:helix-turn-helix domain-containing protein [Streptomyces catenulae]|uniref:Pyridoxamine 5'-phosphate oxidase family protein n=1 Tax=Streptomyces catenulae TaxID=66875 RepID=A0ABV2YWV0_9ACTN|nr:pyridoxamine 5'-phosphate oxidase family protein [Streptomyces catenulae]